MKRFSSSFVRTLAVSLFAIGSFYLGSYLYLNSPPDPIPQNGLAKNFSAFILKSSESDFSLKVNEGTEKIPRILIASWPEKYIRTYNNQEDLRINAEKVRSALAPIAAKTKTFPKNARFSFSNGELKTLTPSINGTQIDTEATANLIVQSIYEGINNAQAVLSQTEPDITPEKIKSLGIKSLLGKGESDFSGSPSSRIHNIKVASEKYNGVIIGLGEEFSFNSALGEVDAETGYKPELVIKSGKLEYEYGGGVCQVSTTMFRAAIHSGLPILERKNHSFPVRYYNPQGFDSTVYPGVVDLKFTNDTPGPILIQSKVVGNIITFEFYGADDKRIVKVNAPTQYDQNPDGSLKAFFDRTVILADGKKRVDTFRSIYKPPVKYESNPLE